MVLQHKSKLHHYRGLKQKVELVHTYAHNSITTSRIWMFYISNKLLAEMSIVCVRAGCEIQWQVMTPNTHCSLFLISHLCVLTCITWKLQSHIWTLCISNDCSITRDIPCVVCVRNPTGDIQPQTCIGHSLIQHCVHMLQAVSYITIWCATTHNNKTHILYDCILCTKWQLCCHPCIVFIRAKLASYTTQCSVFSISHGH